MMRSEVFGDSEKGVAGFVDRFPLDEVSPDLEPSLSFDTNWLQDHRNHRALLDCFWRHVKPQQSLVFFYAKQVPFVEDTGRRVLIGVGRVKTIGELTEYRYDGPPRDKLRSLLWERMVVHSIRPAFEDGFLLPYHDAVAKSDDGRAFDPAETVAFAPEDRFVEFSFATEHVGDDAAISALLDHARLTAPLFRAVRICSRRLRTVDRHGIGPPLEETWSVSGARRGTLCNGCWHGELHRSSSSR